MDWIKFVDLTPVDRQHETALRAAYERVMAGGQYISGWECTAFENEWADYCDARYCVGVSSGFAALSLILRVLDVKSVAIPATTCRPTFAAAVDAGLEDFQISTFVPEDWPVPTKKREAMPVADALVRVHLHGYLSDLGVGTDDWRYVVDDAAQAHGQHWRDNDRESRCHAAAWSFYPTKNLGAYGDAGAVTTNSGAIAKAVRDLSDYRGANGINARLDPLQAAFLRVNLGRLDQWSQIRLEQAAHYNRRFRSLQSEFAIHPFALPPSGIPTNYHHYILRCPFRKRDRLRKHLTKRHIETGIHYPEPGSSYIGEYPLAAQDVSGTVLSLPIGPHLTVKNIERVVEAVNQFYRERN